MKVIPIVTSLVSAAAAYKAVEKKQLSTGVKGAVTVIAGIGGYVGGKKIEGLITPSSGKENVAAVKSAKQQLLQANLLLPADQQQLPTITQAQQKIYAQKLFNAMDGAGTTLQDITDVFNQMQSDI